MLETIVGLKGHLQSNFYLYFLFLYILGGRPVALLSAQMLGLNLFIYFTAVVIMDTVQIPFFSKLYMYVYRIPLIRRLSAKLVRKCDNIQNRRIFSWLRVMGFAGVFIITALPFKGCGIWSGVLLSDSLKLPPRHRYPLIISGSIAGCVLLIGIGVIFLEVKTHFLG